MQTSISVRETIIVIVVFSFAFHNAAIFHKAQPSQGQKLTSGRPATRHTVTIRFSGSSFMPFTIFHQQLVVQALSEFLIPVVGPAEIVSYREGQPHLNAPDSESEQYPFTDVELAYYSDGYDTPTINKLETDMKALSDSASRFFQLGNWSRDTHSTRIMYFNIEPVELATPVLIAPVAVLEAVLAYQLVDMKAPQMTLEKASWLAQAVQTAAKHEHALVLVPSVNTTLLQATLSPQLQSKFKAWQLIEMDVTLHACHQSASDRHIMTGNGVVDRKAPECEVRLLQQHLSRVLQDPSTKQRIGISQAEIVLVRQRPIPEPPASSQADQPWVPPHLDRLDQRWLPLDGQYTANATGTGVNVYLISSGILGAHVEFGYLNGKSGTRVRGAWGYRGLNPLEDCPDAFAWHGYGTYAASIIGGRTVGVAKNATLHSVRIKANCLIAVEGSWYTDALFQALDYVIAHHMMPAVVVIEGWWRMNSHTISDEFQAPELQEKLDAFAAANLTVITGAGSAACKNKVAAHPAVISVGTSWSEGVLGSNYNTTCIDIWALGFGSLVGAVGADSRNISAYKAVSPSLSGGAFLAAGVAAQYLSLNPLASPQQVKQMLLDTATSSALIEQGAAAPTRLLYSKFMQPAVDEDASVQVDKAEADVLPLSTRVAVGISLAVGIAISAAVVSAYFMHRRRKRALTVATTEMQLSPPIAGTDRGSAEWEITGEQIEICLRSDGSEWVLGEGSYGTVVKAMKGGVQAVAVKRLQSYRMEDVHRDRFVQEIALMKYVSRDANITQFYGACLHPSMMLVVELMEGGDLRQALTCDHHGVLGWYQGGKSVALDILRGLHFLHEAGVIHRDIKSKNILLTKEGKAKISDVGLAQFLEQQTCSKHESHYYGTLAWAAPELLLGEEFSEKADIYSFGVVLWELVTQEVPLRGALHEPAVPSQCPQQVADAIVACTKRDPSLRPHAKELYAQLRACPPLNFSAAAISLPPVPPGLGHPELLLPSYGSTGSSWLHSCSTSSSPLMRRSPVQQHANAFNSCGHLHGRQLFSELVSQAAGTCNLTEPQLAVPGRSRAEEKAPAGAEACDERTHTDQLAYGQDGHVGISVDKSQTDETKAANAMYVAASAIWRSQPDGSIV